MNYFIWTEGHEEGPLTIEELNHRIDRGTLSPGVLCRAEDSSDWVRLSEILGIETPNRAAQPPRQRRLKVRHWVILGMICVAGLLTWLITKTQLWQVVAVSTLGVFGMIAALVVVALVATWAVLWTIFPVFVFFYLQDIAMDLSEIRRRGAKWRPRK